MPCHATQQVHAGYEPAAPHRPVVPPIHQTTAFRFPDHATAASMFRLETPGFTYSRTGNPTVAVFENRLAALEKGKGLDWATAEALAFGSVMREGCVVRISGQNVGRGTFSQRCVRGLLCRVAGELMVGGLGRHAMLVDQKTEGVVVPLNLALDCEGRLELANSSLSEMGVLGVSPIVSASVSSPMRTCAR